MSIFNTVVSWFQQVRTWFSLAVEFLDAIDNAYPGLVAIITSLVDVAGSLISRGTITKSEAREQVVADAKEELKSSPRFVPEWAIRAVLEAVVARRKGPSTYYDNIKVRDHAVRMLKGSK